MSELFPNLGLGGGGDGKRTANAGTVILKLIRAMRNAFTRLMKFSYTAGATAHDVTVLRPIGKTTLTAAVTAGDATVYIAANPGPSGNALAANDFIALRNLSGNQEAAKVSSISGLTVILTAGTVFAYEAGSACWDFGIITDTDPNTGLAHPIFAGAATATIAPADVTGAGIVETWNKDEPLLIYSGNATNAGVLDYEQHLYTSR